MSPPDADACQKCGKAIPPGTTECLHEELPTPGAVEPESTQTMPPLAAIPVEAAPAVLTRLESLASEVESPEALVGRQLGEYAVRR